MKFTKMEGCGNDYVYINGFEIHIPEEEKEDFIRKMSDRHFGIGGDGVIFINPSDQADFEMEMYNADGSYGAMCGNGIRCVAKYVYDKKMTDKTEFTVIADGKIKYLTVNAENGKAVTVKVNMGSPVLEPAKIPVVSNLEKVVDEPITAGEMSVRMTCVSMGNPHAVIFVDQDVKELDLPKIGPFFENHELFPARVNTEFVRVIDRQHVEMRVWERGSGETLACGTGACAVTVACILNGLTDDTVFVKLLGGTLEITWDREANLVYMTGPARIAFEGEVEW